MKNSPDTGLKKEADSQAASRKEDHIDLAFKSAVAAIQADDRFYYEPMLQGHQLDNEDFSIEFLGRKMNYPIWISSMTGGTEKANTINHNLAKIAGEFGFGMGLGSCRQLLYEDKRMHEFDIRPFMPDQPICINLGIAQIEEMIDSKELYQINILAERLKADGLIVHINPLQEWLQPEGDLIKRPPIETLSTLLEHIQIPVIVKEVGQGFGIESLKALLALPIAAVDLAGFGGTNFSKLELMRSDEIRYNSYKELFNIGHTCTEMVGWINQIKTETPEKIKCEQIIFSGGIKNFLDGYYFVKKCSHPSFYAQASGFLKYAMDLDDLRKHARLQIEGYKLAQAMLTIKQ